MKVGHLRDDSSTANARAKDGSSMGTFRRKAGSCFGLRHHDRHHHDLRRRGHEHQLHRRPKPRD
jgi:hypothetical protein